MTNGCNVTLLAEIEPIHSSFSTGAWALMQRSVMALGAHFLTDVLAAIVFGIIWLTLCLIAGKPMRRRTARFQSVIPLLDGSEALLAPVEQRTLPVRISEAN
jgi:membrane-associated phospholipid phosphatase